MSRLLVVTAVRPESRAVLRVLSHPRRVRSVACPCWDGRAGPHQVTVVQGGPGRRAARRALTVTPGPYDLLVSFGVAGALVPGAAAGDLVLSSAVLWEESGALRRYDLRHELATAVETALPPELQRAAVRGALFSSPVVLATSAAKEEAGRRYGAVAVEMEAAALAAHALESGVDLLPLRVILDPADFSLDRLPPQLDRSWAARVRLLGQPAAWRLLLTLRRQMAAAGVTLTRAAAALLPALAARG